MGCSVDTDRVTRWITIGANLAILVGLVLVLVELSQNRLMMRAQIRHDLSMGIVEMLNVPANNRQLSDVLYRAQTGEDLNGPDLFQFQLRTNALFRYWENVHYQYRLGLYDRAEFEKQRDAWQAFFASTPPGREYWCAVRTLYSLEFMTEMDQLMVDSQC